jgi:LPS-assembly lipoprotein
MLLLKNLDFGAGKLAVVTLAFVMSTMLSACSFSPLYGQRADSDFTVDQRLALVHIHSIKDRIGQDLHNNLLFHLNIKGRPANPMYELDVTLKETSANLGVKKSAVVTRGNLKLSAVFTLSKAANIASKTEASSLITASVTTISSYNIPQAQYSALAALKDARTRAVKEIAYMIKTRLGVYFRQNTK